MRAMVRNPNPPDWQDFLVLLGLACLFVTVLTYVLADALATSTVLSDFEPEKGDYRALYSAATRAVTEQAVFIRFIALAEGALGIVFLIWSADRRRLVRKLAKLQNISETPEKPS